jgi:hypothetical protein
MCSLVLPLERNLIMKYVRAGITLSLVLVLSALIGAWPAQGQQAGPVPDFLQQPGAELAGPAAMPPGPIASPYQEMTLGKPQDPEMAKVSSAEASADREVQNLMRDYKRTEDADERGKIKTKLVAALAKQFDAQQKRRDLELARVEAQLKKLRELMKKRDEERKTIIDRRADQLVRDAEGLGWAPPSGFSTSSSFGAQGLPRMGWSTPQRQ